MARRATPNCLQELMVRVDWHEISDLRPADKEYLFGDELNQPYFAEQSGSRDVHCQETGCSARARISKLGSTVTHMGIQFELDQLACGLVITKKRY